MSQPERDEEWRAIAGYVGKYEVSSHGRVRTLFGETATCVKLTDAAVMDIRREWAAGASFLSIAGKRGMSAPAIRSAVIGKKWKHLPLVPRARAMKEIEGG